MTVLFWECFALFGVLAIVTLSTGEALYALLALILLCLWLLNLLGVLWTLLSTRVRVKASRSEVTRGETIQLVFHARHFSLLPAADMRVQFSAPSALSDAREISVSIPPFVQRSYRHAIACPHRGSYSVGITRIRARDLFGLCDFSRKSRLKMLHVDVYPNVYSVPPLEPRAADSGAECLSRASEDSSSPSDVRAWQDGDELKKIHWKLSLRKRTLMARTFEESARPDTLIIPNLSPIPGMREQALTIEDCVCEACLSMARAQLRAGYPVRMPLIGASPSEIAAQFPEDFPLFTQAMLRVAFDCPYPYEQVLMPMLGRMPRTGGAVLVTSNLSGKVADIAIRLVRNGIHTKLVWISDAPRADLLEMSERLKMEGVLVETVHAWEDVHTEVSL